MFILDLNQKTKLFSAAQIEAINIYALLHSTDVKLYKNESVNQFDIDPNALKIAEMLHHDYANPDDLDMDLLVNNLTGLIDDYELARNFDHGLNGEYSNNILVGDHILYLSLLEFSDFVKDCLSEAHQSAFNRLFTVIES